MSGYEGSNFAPFNTGNPQWDQGFNSLSRGLFGDASAYGRGQAAGAIARENIIKGDTSISERNAAASQLLMALGLDRTGQPQLPPTPTFHPSGVPGGAPIMDPPAGMQMSAPPPVQPGPGGSLVGLLGRIFGAGDSPNAKGYGTTGTPPPVSSPAPNAGAPPAPNTTTTNGQVPTNDQGSGPFNYNAINTTGGGRQYAPAAQSNGSPAPVPINLGSLMALGAYAGQDANVIKQGGQAYIASAFDHGVIPWNTATQLSGLTGNNAPYESDQATGRTRISEAGATTREGMRLGQQESQFVRTAQPGMVTTDANGNPIVNLPPPKGSTTPVPVGRGFNEPLEQQRREPYQTGGGGPYGSGPQTATKGTAPGQPGYSAEADRVNNTPVSYVDDKGTTRSMPYGEYVRQGAPFPLTRDSLEAVRASAAIANQVGGGTDPSKAVRDATQASSVPDQVKGTEGFYQRALVDQDIRRRYAPLQDVWAGITSGRRDVPAEASSEMRADILSRANDIERDPNSGAAFHNMPEAISRATDELIKTGAIPDDKNVDRAWQSVLAANPNIKKTDKGAVFQIPTLKRYQPGALGLAPAGGKDNQLVDLGSGRKGVVRNGFVYPYQ